MKIKHIKTNKKNNLILFFILFFISLSISGIASAADPSVDIEAYDDKGNVISDMDDSTVYEELVNSVKIRSVASTISPITISNHTILFTEDDWTTTGYMDCGANSSCEINNICVSSEISCPIAPNTTIKYKVEVIDSSLASTESIENQFVVEKVKTWIKTYGTNKIDLVGNVIQTKNNGFLFAGHTSDQKQTTVVQINDNGDIGFEAVIDQLESTTSQDKTYRVLETNDDGIVVAYSNKNDATVIVKYKRLNLHSPYTIEQQKYIFSSNSTFKYLQDIKQTSDGGFILTGYSDNDSNWFLVKMTSTFSNSWSKSINGYQNHSVEQTFDGGYITSGIDNSGGTGLLVTKFSGSGLIIWSKKIGEGQILDNYSSFIKQTSDGGYITSAVTKIGSGDNGVIIKLNSSGALLWTKTYGGLKYDGRAFSIDQTNDGGYILAGGTNSFGVVSEDALIIKLDALGDVQWAKTFGGSQIEYATSVKQTRDEGYIIVGATQSFGAGGYDVFAMRLNSSGNIEEGCANLRNLDINLLNSCTDGSKLCVEDVPFLSIDDKTLISQSSIQTEFPSIFDDNVTSNPQNLDKEIICGSTNRMPIRTGAFIGASWRNCAMGSGGVDASWLLVPPGLTDPDPGDYINAYRLQIFKVISSSPVVYGDLVYDSGKVIGYPFYHKNIPGTIPYELGVKRFAKHTTYWDNHDVQFYDTIEGFYFLGGGTIGPFPDHQWPDPDFTWNPVNPNASQNTNFNPDSTITYAGSSITNWSWDWDNDSIYDEINQYPTHSFSPDGTYPVQLQIKDSLGGKCYFKKEIVIGDPPPTIDFFDAMNKNDDSISDGPDGISVTADDNTVFDIFSNKIDIKSIASDADGVISSHIIEFTKNNWVDTFTKDCGGNANCETNICSQPGFCPLAVGDVVKYKSIVLDNDLQITTSEKEFEVTESITWAKSFDDVVIHSMSSVSSGGYIAVGWLLATNKLIIAKLDIYGNQEWTREFDDLALGMEIQETSDGGYIISGRGITGASVLFLLKINSSGDQTWAKQIENYYINNDIQNDKFLQQTADGGYILTGKANDNSALVVIKLNSSGEHEWVKEFGGTTDSGLSVEQTSDGGYIVAGWKRDGDYDSLIFKLDSLGNQIWAKEFGGLDIEKFSSVQQTIDGGYIVAGLNTSNSAFTGDASTNIIVLKLNSVGDQTWASVFGRNGFDYISTIIQDSNGNYVAVGSLDGKGLIIKLNTAGNQVWAKELNLSEFYAIREASDKSGYLVSGVYNSKGLAIKIDLNGNVSDCSLGFVLIPRDEIDGLNCTNGGLCSNNLPADTNSSQVCDPGSLCSNNLDKDTNNTSICSPVIDSLCMEFIPKDINNSGCTSGSACMSKIKKDIMDPGCTGGSWCSDNITLIENNTCLGSVPNVNPNVTADINYCFSSPAGLNLNWDFSDPEDGNIQTAYEIKLTRTSDGAVCNIPKTFISDTSILGSNINNKPGCANFIDYGNNTYDWQINVYDSDDNSSGFVNGSIFPNSPTPDHAYPEQGFTYVPNHPGEAKKTNFENNPGSYPNYSHSWDFCSATSGIPIHTEEDPQDIIFPTKGDCAVTLTVTEDANGKSCIGTEIIRVRDSPTITED